MPPDASPDPAVVQVLADEFRRVAERDPSPTWTTIARDFLASDWLASHDAEVARAAAKEERERIAQAIETDPGLRLGHNVSVVCSCLRCEVANGAARIAREEGRADVRM
jgi:hypothetical protein